eukprot:364167-Chlamydomonas_euryale.AAC.2
MGVLDIPPHPDGCGAFWRRWHAESTATAAVKLVVICVHGPAVVEVPPAAYSQHKRVCKVSADVGVEAAVHCLPPTHTADAHLT